jgi:hypothetical protein
MVSHENAAVVFFNGKIVTLDSNDTIATAVAIKNGRILMIGSDDEAKRVSNSATDLIDLRGKTVLPGFIDSHCHLGLATLSFRYYVDGRCPPNKAIADILERIRQRVRETPKGEWIIVHGSMFGNYKLAEKRYPTREELDSVAPENPVVFLASLHTSIVNTYVLKSAHIAKKSPELPEGGEIERDKTTGQPTGVLKECHQLLPIPPFTYEQIKETLSVDIPLYWVRQGFTTAHSFADAVEFMAYQELLKEGALPLRVQAMVFDIRNRPDSLESLINLGILPGLGNDWLKIGGVKIFVDGAFMGLSAATHEPYLNLPDKNYCGILRYDARSLNEVVLRAHNAGLQLCIHAMGDKAQDWALKAYENALKVNPRCHRHRIEHFGCDMGSPELRRGAKALGIVPIITTGWLYAYGDFIEHYLGPRRQNQSFALRSMIDAGLKPAHASDQCGTEPLTLDPFFSIWCAVTRQTWFGNRLVPEQAITVNEALRMWTINAAYSGFEEELKGSIEPGKFADLIVISRDILTIPEDQIRDIRVDMTIIDGKIVYMR